MKSYSFLILICFGLWSNLVNSDTGFSDYTELLRVKLLKNENLNKQLVSDVLENSKYTAKVVSYSKKKPEIFLDLSTYLRKQLSNTRIATGIKKLQTHRALLSEITEKYKVSPYILVALWGMESDYGRHLGKVPVFDALLSLAYSHQSSKEYEELLIDAFQLIEREGIDWRDMKGSLVGDLGQTQFSVSDYLDYAVDGNDNGTKDLWNELPDVMHSSANFMNRQGWQNQLLWGEEVKIPKGFNVSGTGLDITLPVKRWHDQGVQHLDGRRLDLRNKHIKASLLVLQGKNNRAFLLYDNFYTLFNWNDSINYAVAVGLLADAISKGGTEEALDIRVIGEGKKKTDKHKNKKGTVYATNSKKATSSNASTVKSKITRENVRLIQRRLRDLGYNPGPIDGFIGPKTRKAVRKFQMNFELEVNGRVTHKLIEIISSKI